MSRFALIVVLFAAALLPAAFAPAARAEDTILIGEYGSMTGAEATFGQMTHNGIMLAVEERNAKGGVLGKKIVIKSYDDEGKAQMAGTVVTRLVTDDKVVAVLGEVASSLSIAGGRVCQQYGIPMVTPSSTNERVTKIGDMISRVCFLDSFQGYAVARFATDNLKAKRVALLFDQKQAYSKGLKDDFRKAFTSMGGEIAGREQAFSGGDQDFGAQLTTIRSENPDAIFLPGYYTDVGNVALQARKLGIKCPLLGGDGWDSAKLGEIAGKAIDDCYYSNHYSHEDPSPAVQNYVKKFQAKYDMIPDGLSALGYDAANLLFDAIERAKTTDSKAIAAAIAASKDFKGVTGTFSIDANRNASKPAVILKMKDGKPTYVATIQPQK